jgi:hypothetical protein
MYVPVVLIVLQTIVKNKEGKLFTSFIYSLFGVACAADHVYING